MSIEQQPAIIVDIEVNKPISLPEDTQVFVHETGILYSFDSTLPNLYRIVYATADFYTQLDSVTIANTTNELTMFGSSAIGSRILPFGFFNVGRNIVVHIRGYLKRQSGNVTIKVKLSSVVIGTTTGLVGSANNDLFDIDFRFTTRTTGAAGSCIGQGKFDNWNSGTRLQMKNLAPVTIDTTIVNTIDCTWQWSNANAENSVTATNAIISI